MKGVFHYRCYLDGEMLARGGVTVAWLLQGDKVIYGVSVCDPRDNFCKHTGRVKAEGYLQSKRLEYESRRGWLVCNWDWAKISHEERRNMLFSLAEGVWRDSLGPKVDVSRPFCVAEAQAVLDWVAIKAWKWVLR